MPTLGILGPRSSTGRTPPAGPARRLDWRHLLPVGLPVATAVIAEADDDLVSAASEVGLAEVVTNDFATGRSDLVALLAGHADGSGRSAGSVASAVAPGGCLWWEVDRRRPGNRLRSSRRLRRQLEAEGLEVLGCFGIRPAPERAEWYVPLDHPHAVEWFLDSVYAPVSRMQAIGEIGVRLLLRSAPDRLGSFAPFHAVLARRPMEHPSVPAHAPGTMAVVRRAVLPSLDIVTSGARPALVTHGGGRAVLMPFEPEGRRPKIVVKAPLRSSASARNEHEHSVLTELAATAPDSIPSALALVRSAPDDLLAVQSALQGRSMARACAVRSRLLVGKVDDLAAVGAWLVQLHSTPLDADRTWDGAANALVVERCEEYARRFGTVGPERLLFVRTRERSADLVGATVPTVWEHSDLSVWNVLNDRGAVGVLDWEGARAGLPLVDLLRFTTHWHEAVRGCRTQSQRHLALAELVRGDRHHRATVGARRVIDQYVRDLGLPVGLEDVLHVAGWVELAIRRDDHRRDELRTRSTAPRREGNEAIDYVGALTEVLV